MISLIEDKRAVPVYWIILAKKGCSNLQEQKALICPVLQMFKGYRLLLLGDREFHSIKLANWLHSKQINFVLRQKKTRAVKLAREADSQELPSKHRDCDESEVAQYDEVVVFVNQSVRRAKCQHKLVPNLQH